MTTPKPRVSTDRPNIIHIVADDMGHVDLGFINGGRSRTPHLDRLAADGVVLRNHYSASPVCAPARAAFLTGRYSHRTGAIDTLEGRGLDRIGLRERLVADDLRAAGYATGLVGKWHNGALDDRFHPTNRGFDEFVGFCGGWADYWDWTIYRGSQPQATDGRYLTDVWTAEAIDFVHRHQGEPFYLHLAYNAPHWPLQAPQDKVSRYRRIGFSRAISTIYAMVEVMDDGIGRLLAALDETGVRSTTFVLFTSDNGPEFAEIDGESTKRFNRNLRGAKTQVLEGGINVPAIASWPAGGLSGGRFVDGAVHFCDWLPTTLSAAGVSLAQRPGRALDGSDQLPALRGRDGGESPTRFWQWNRYKPVSRCNAAIRDGDWKLVFAPIEEAMRLDEDDATMDRELKYYPRRHSAIRTSHRAQPAMTAQWEAELFDLSRDPRESRNLAANHPDRVRQMTAALDTWFADVEADRALASAAELGGDMS